MILSEHEIDGLNALVERPENLAMARRIRAFRPYPVRAVSDAQLAEIVRLSRRSARKLGLKERRLVQRWIMADALLAPQFYELPDVVEHFEKARGTPDAKAEDVFRLMKITYRQNGRGDEVWW